MGLGIFLEPQKAEVYFVLLVLILKADVQKL